MFIVCRLFLQQGKLEAQGTPQRCSLLQVRMCLTQFAVAFPSEATRVSLDKEGKSGFTGLKVHATLKMIRRHLRLPVIVESA